MQGKDLVARAMAKANDVQIANILGFLSDETPLVFGTETDHTEFEADGTIKFVGTATAWEDLRFPATSINPAGAANPMGFDTTNIGFTASASLTQVIAIIGQMPHGWKEGSTIYPHLHWMPTTTGSGNVLWRMEYKWTNVEGTESGSWTSIDILDAADGTAYKHQIAQFPSIDGTGKTLSSMLSIKISRIGGDGTDTYGADALLKEFDIHYEISQVGSKTQFGN